MTNTAAPLVARPFPLVLAGPSGSGKTTVAHALVRHRDDVRFSVSATTRPPRPDEREGVDYQFMTRGLFERLIRDGLLLEWAEVHGHLYGTPRYNLDQAAAGGVHLLLDIDVQGARSVRQSVPETVSVFLLPPGVDQVIERLRRRGSEDPATISRRLDTAVRELAEVGTFDYLVVNDSLELAVRTVETILEAERCRVDRIRDAARERSAQLAEELRAALSVGDPNS